MKYRLVIVDVDGTLIPPAGHPTTGASTELIETVRKLSEEGVIFTLATARSLDWVEGLVKSLNLSSILILDNGARLYDLITRKYVVDLKINPNRGSEILQYIFNHGLKPFYVNDGQRYQFAGGSIHNQALTKIMILHLPPGQAEELYDEISRIFRDVAITKSISGSDPPVVSLHFTNLQARKDKAVEYISDYLKIPKEEIIGIGDSYNDVDFLNRCGLKIAMGNALPEVKKIADYTTLPYYEEGVAQVLKKFILEGKNE